MPSLLDKAKAIPSTTKPKKSYTEDDVELVMGWINGDITLTQLAKVKEISEGYTYAYIAQVCRFAFHDNGKKK